MRTAQLDDLTARGDTKINGGVKVEYIPASDRCLIIRVTRPGEEPVDVYADIYPQAMEKR